MKKTGYLKFGFSIKNLLNHYFHLTMMVQTYDLRQICKGMTCVLFDTSAIINHFPRVSGGTCDSGQIQFIKFLRQEVLNGAPIRITTKVVEEYLDPNWVKSCETHGERPLPRHRKSLVEAFKQKGGIVTLDSFGKKEVSFYLAVKGLLSRFGYALEVDLPDIDLILYTITLAHQRKQHVALVTSDYGLRRNAGAIFPLAKMDLQTHPIYQRVADHRFQPW